MPFPISIITTSKLKSLLRTSRQSLSIEKSKVYYVWDKMLRGVSEQKDQRWNKRFKKLHNEKLRNWNSLSNIIIIIITAKYWHKLDIKQMITRRIIWWKICKKNNFFDQDLCESIILTYIMEARSLLFRQKFVFLCVQCLQVLWAWVSQYINTLHTSIEGKRTAILHLHKSQIHVHTQRFPYRNRHEHMPLQRRWGNRTKVSSFLFVNSFEKYVEIKCQLDARD